MLWSRHRARLESSLDQLGAGRGTTVPDETALSELLRANDLEGRARLRVIARRSVSQQWEVEASVSPCDSPGPLSDAARLTIERWASAPPLIGHKTLSRFAWDLARERALAAGADDALLVDASESVLETSISNVWVVRGGVVSTPPAPESCLPGVMRGWLLQHLDMAGLSFDVRRIDESEIAVADELWLSNSIQGVRRVGVIQDRQWREWPVFDRLVELGIPAPGWPKGSKG